ITKPQGALVLRAAGKDRVVLGGRPAKALPGAADTACGDQRLSGSRECLAEGGHLLELHGRHGVNPTGREQVTPERDVDDAVRVRGRLLQQVEILEAAATDLRAERGQGRRGSIRPGQASDLVPSGDEPGDD